MDRAENAVALIQAIDENANKSLTVCDIGCGDMKLRRFLMAALPAATYRGFDLVPQNADVIPWDIRKDSLPMQCDVAVMLGVIEYIEDVPEVLRRLSVQARHLVVSYVISDYSSYTPEKLRDLGWLHHQSKAEFIKILTDSGFQVERTELADNRLTVLALCHSLAVQ